MNLIELGIDTSSFTDQKRQTLQEFISLFNQLERYDGLKVNPVMGEGLSSFNNSITQTSKLLDEINSKFQTLSVRTQSTSNVTKSATTSTSELTAAQREQARINEQLQKTWERLSLSTSEEAKALALLKVELNEANKANQDLAKSQSLGAQLREENRRKAIQEKEELRQVIAAHKAEAEIQRQDAAEKKQAQKEAEALANKYALLTKVLQEQTAAYRNLFIEKGKSSPETIQAFDNLKATSNQIIEIDKNVDNATGRAKLFGGALSSMFSQIRTLAYILPGLGIAGIFNIAFEAIGKVISELDLFSTSTERALDIQLAMNKAQSDFAAILKDVQDAYHTVLGNEQAAKNELEYAEAGNKSARTRLELEYKIADIRAVEANKKFFKEGGFDREEETRRKFIEAEEQLKRAREEVRKTQSGDEGNNPDSVFGTLKERREKELEIAQTMFKLSKDEYVKIKGINEENAQSIADLNAKEIELNEFKAEQIRKVNLETSKIEAENIQSKNRIILADERSTMNERIISLEKIRQATIYAAEANLKYVLSRPDARNSDGSLTAESQIAIKNSQEDKIEAQRKYNEQSEKVRIEYFQRYLKALTEIDKDEVESNAIKNERIYKNDNKTLEQRLSAYTGYILDKQHLDYLEEQRELQKGAKERGGKTSLTQEEKDAISSQSLMQRANKQADVEKQVYDIVYTSTQKQLKEILSFNRLSESDMKRSYKEEVDALNNSYEKQKISFEQFAREKNALSKKYRIIELENNIKDDNTELARLQNLIKNQKDLRDAAKADLDIAQVHADANPNDLDAQRNLSEAKGKYEGFQKTILDTDKAMQDAQNKLTNDGLALALSKYDKLEKAEKQYAQVRKEIIDQLYNFAKTAIDGEFQKRLELIEKNKQLIDEEYGYEIAAIEKSSLTAKDKAALDIQLNAEKLARDKDAQWQEKELKHQQAVIDRELSIAHILWSTEEAVMAALSLPLPPPAPEILAAERGALGAISVATVLATPIPYAEGTPKGGHDKPDNPVLIGEAGLEAVKEPYKSMYFINTPTVTYLPKGTDVIPMKDFTESMFEKPDNSWEQIRWLGGVINKTAKKEIRNIFKPNMNVNLGFETYKRKILGQ